MLQNSILSYYGFTNFDGVMLQSHQFEYTNPIGNIPEMVGLSEVKESQTLVLFMSIWAATMSERIIYPPVMIAQRYGLMCDLLFEHKIKTFEGVIRICAVKVNCGQFRVLLKTLFDYSSCSFAIMLDEGDYSNLITRLTSLFENGLLTPKVIQECSNVALNENASFLHILRGNDGYSINYFSKQ